MTELQFLSNLSSASGAFKAVIFEGKLAEKMSEEEKGKIKRTTETLLKTEKSQRKDVLTQLGCPDVDSVVEFIGRYEEIISNRKNPYQIFQQQAKTFVFRFNNKEYRCGDFCSKHLLTKNKKKETHLQKRFFEFDFDDDLGIFPRFIENCTTLKVDYYNEGEEKLVMKIKEKLCDTKKSKNKKSANFLDKVLKHAVKESDPGKYFQAKIEKNSLETIEAMLSGEFKTPNEAVLFQFIEKCIEFYGSRALSFIHCINPENLPKKSLFRERYLKYMLEEIRYATNGQITASDPIVNPIVRSLENPSANIKNRIYQNRSGPITRPSDYEPNIFTAIDKQLILSVQFTLFKEPNKASERNKKGGLTAFRYAIEKGNIDMVNVFCSSITRVEHSEEIRSDGLIGILGSKFGADDKKRLFDQLFAKSDLYYTNSSDESLIGAILKTNDFGFIDQIFSHHMFQIDKKLPKGRNISHYIGMNITDPDVFIQLLDQLQEKYSDHFIELMKVKDEEENDIAHYHLMSRKCSFQSIDKLKSIEPFDSRKQKLELVM